MVEPHGPCPPGSPPAAAGPVLASWPLTQAAELSGLRRSAAEVLVGRAVPAGTPVREEQLLLLVLSELATNALLHGTGPVTVTLSSHGPSWLLDVRDRDARAAPAHRPRDDGRTGGHGLRILDRATTEWGWYRESDGEAKHVWALVSAGPAEEGHR